MKKTGSPFKKSEKRSPFPRRSLPQPGESLREKVDELYDKRVNDVFIFAFGVAGAAVAAWVQELMGQAISPWTMTVIAVGVIAFGFYRARKFKSEIADLGLGLRGERIVGNSLEDMRKHGYRVFHDIPSENGNVDHVLIGPAGIFAVETKTISKPAKGNCEVHYDGTTVRINGAIPDRDPIVQAEACANQIKELLKRMTERDVSVRGVVLYPEWYVNSNFRTCRTWVMNLKGFKKILAGERRALPDEDIALFEDRLRLHLSAE